MDRVKKLAIYAREQVRHAWLVDPLARTHDVTIPGVPDVWATGQGGLQEVLPHPRLSENRFLYLAHRDRSSARAVARMFIIEPAFPSWHANSYSFAGTSVRRISTVQGVVHVFGSSTVTW